MRSFSVTTRPLMDHDERGMLIDITVTPSWPQTLQYFDDFGLTAAPARQV